MKDLPIGSIFSIALLHDLTPSAGAVDAPQKSSEEMIIIQSLQKKKSLPLFFFFPHPLPFSVSKGRLL